MKQCSKCKEFKSLECFYKDRHSRDGYCYQCHDCRSAVQKLWRKLNPDLAAIKDKARWANYDRDRDRSNHRDWRERNRKRRNAYRRQLHAKLMAHNSSYRWAYKIRRKVYLALRGVRKSAPTEQLIGCTFQELRRYLEMLWEPWMNWGNYGIGPNTWQIDHVSPVAAFDLSDPDQQKICWHYTNLRPLASEKNLAKGKRTDAVFV